MNEAFFCIISTLRSMLRNRRELALENLALRQQLAILARAQPHRRLKKMDRLFWVWLSRMWKSWRESLIVVKPDTVVRWYRKGFALYWTWLSKRNPIGRRELGPITRRQMADGGIDGKPHDVEYSIWSRAVGGNGGHSWG